MKPSFKSDSGYATAFCALWLLLFSEYGATWSVPWWLLLGLVWLFVRLCALADPMRDAPGFLTRFTHAGTEVMLRSVMLGILLPGGVLIYWGVTTEFADALTRLDKAPQAGLATADGRIFAVCSAVVWLAVLGGTPLWLRRQPRA